MKTFKQFVEGVHSAMDIDNQDMETNPGMRSPRKKKEEPPFEGPYKSKPSATAGKYGLGHSTAKHLAKQGMKMYTKEEAEAGKDDDHLHVSHAGNGKYKVHSVGKNFADGIQKGEHLSDTELDDASEMGAKIKHIK